MTQVYASAPSLARQLDLCADAVAAVRSGRSLTDVLAGLPVAARPGVQALSFHVLRHLGTAQALRGLLAPRSPPPKVEALLLTALALLWPQDDPPYAEHTLVDQAVAAARQRTPGAAGFVNAVLRRCLRERLTLLKALASDPVARWNHPAWWIARLRQDWPEQADALLAAANQRAPMSLRVNLRRGSPSAYLARLQAAGLPARRADGATEADPLIVLAHPCAVTALPGFAEGDVSVQDASAQIAAPLLLGPQGLPAGARVLDACAAPGGKTAHLLELADLDLLALDQDAQRLTRVQDTLDRLGLRARLQACDAAQPASWWDGRPFDAILLDAPCSASGIVRRHPDVRWLRRATDIDALARTQAALLDALWPLLKPGGRLVYATCSILKAEGAQAIDAFLQRQPPGSVLADAAAPGHLLPLPQNPGTPPPGGGQPAGDGFFYALLIKR